MYILVTYIYSLYISYIYSLCYFHLFPQTQNAQWHWADTCDTKAVDLTCLSMQGLAIDRLKNTMTLNYITSAVGVFLMVHEQVHSHVHYIFYTDVFDIDSSTTLCMYIHIIYIHIYSHIQNIISICTLSQPFRELSLVINMRVPSLQNLRSDSLRTDVGDL